MDRTVVRVVAPQKLETFVEPLPAPGPHEMVVRIVIAGICHSELPTYLGEGAWETKGPLGFPCILPTVPYPAVMGHEPTGIVESVGAEVTRFAPGDNVSGACGGAFASHVVVSEFAPFVKLPASVLVQDCLAEPVMCCCNIARAVAPPQGGSVAVVGCGYMGLITICLLRAAGVRRIAAFDILPKRLALAKECGATDFFDATDPDVVQKALALTGGTGFDRAVELSKGLAGLSLATSLIKMPTAQDRGIIAASSVYDKHEPWPTDLGFELMCRCPELHFVHPGFIPDTQGLMEEAVQAYATGVVPAGGLITHRFAPEEMGRAYEIMLNGDERYLKGAVVF